MNRNPVAGDGDGLFKMRNRKVGAAQPVERQSQVAAGLGVIGVYVQELPIAFDRRFEVSLPLGDHAQEKQGIGALPLAQQAFANLAGPLQMALSEMMPCHAGQPGDLAARGLVIGSSVLHGLL